MKATRTNYDEMWDKYFDSYQGWLYVADRIFPSQEGQRPVINTNVQVECNASYTLSDPEDSPSDKFYSVDKDDYYLNDFQPESYSEKEDAKNSDEIINTNQDKGREDNGPADATECNDSHIEVTECNNSPIEDMEKNNNPVEAVKDIKSDKFVRCRPLTKQPDDIIFECDTGLGYAFVTQKEESIIYTPPRQCTAKTLGSIAIDTTCLKKPKTKVLFSCNIYFKPRSGQGTSQLEFILSRSCNNSAESPIGNWVYDLVDRSEHLSQTFKFNFCSCNSFPGSYNYFIRVIPVYIKNCAVLLTNCHIDAFAQSK